jgi:hypothetical protein
MATKRTKECSRVFFAYPEEEEPMKFESREYLITKNFSWKHFKSDKSLDLDSVEDLLNDKLKQLAKKKNDETIELESSCQHFKSTWEHEVNRKRRLVASCLLAQPHRNLAEVCSYTGCSFSLVKKVADDLDFQGEVSTYTYSNKKTDTQLAQLNKSIEQVNGSFITIGDLKRSNPKCSRRYISKALHSTGLSWLKVRKNTKAPKKPAYTDQEVLQTVSHLAQSLAREDVDSY